MKSREPPPLNGFGCTTEVISITAADTDVALRGPIAFVGVCDQ